MSVETKDAGQAGAPVPVIEGFEFIERRGSGPESELWKARQISLDRIVAVKVLAESLSRNPADIKQFELESKVAAKLKHRGLVQIYDFGRTNHSGQYYFVMEFIAGYSVGDWVRRKGRLPEDDCLTIARSVSEALKHAWEHARAIHCNLKPDNILVDSDGSIKIADLGLARAVYTAKAKPTDGLAARIMGVPNYMSPEQARGDKHLDYRADIYSLGASLYHILTGVLPFDDKDAEKILLRQANEALEHPSKLESSVSQDVGDMVMKMLAKNPAMRHQSWAEVEAETTRLQKAKLSSAGQTKVEDKIQLDPKKDQPEIKSAADTVPCPNCKKLVPSKAESCPFCSKPIKPSQPARKPVLKLKAKPEPTARQPADRPADATPVAAMRRSAAPAKSAIMENVRLVLSLGLVVFLVYYGYQRIIRHRDIMQPAREWIHTEAKPTINRVYYDFRARVVSLFTGSSLESITQGNIERRGDRSPEMSAEFLAILEECEENTPKTGDYIEIRLEGQENPISGKLQRVGINGVIIGVEKGVVQCPFLVMEEESRLLFSPEEKARLIMKQRAMTNSPTL